MRRINEYLAKRTPDLRRRFDIASMLISRVAQIHRNAVAHRDLAAHSVWYDDHRSRVTISGFGAAHYPERATIADMRLRLMAATSRLPEDVEGYGATPGTPFQQDVFLLASLVWSILTDSTLPKTSEAVVDWTDNAFASAPMLPEKLKPWFARALAWAPNERFPTAAEMHDAFLEATRSSEPSPAAALDFERFERNVPPYRAYKEIESLGSDSSEMWISEVDGERVVVKCWSDNVDRHGANALPMQRFLEMSEKLKLRAPDWMPSIIDYGIWKSTVYLVYRFLDADRLESTDISDVDEAYDFCAALALAVNDLHTFGAHGDLSPRNVLVVAKADSGFVPQLIDMPDYLCLVQADRYTPAYAPPKQADAQGRDRYAVAKIICELLTAHDVTALDETDSGRLLQSAERCIQNDDDAGLTLRPILSTIEQNRNLAKLPSIVSFIASPDIEGEKRLILANDGIYHVVLDQSEAKLFIVGLDEQLEVALDRNSLQPEYVRARATGVGTLEWAEARELCSFRGEIHVASAKQLAPNSLAWLLSRSEIKERLDSMRADRSAKGEPVPQRPTVAQQRTHAPIADVEKLWRSTIEVEDEARPEAIVTGPAAWDAASRTLSVPCEYTVPDFEFDRSQPISVFLNGRRIGDLAVELITSAELPIRDAKSRLQLAPGTKLSLQGSQDWDNFERRRKAITRILDDEAVIPNLLEYFKPSCAVTPDELGTAAVEDSDISAYGLNETQAAALRKLWQLGPVGLLQGPPGTGKTTFIASFVHFAVTKGGLKNVLLLSQSHAAVNNAAERLLAMFGEAKSETSLLRVGQISKVSDPLVPFHSESAQDHYREMFISEKKDRISAIGTELGLPTAFLDELFEALERVRVLSIALRPIGQDGEEDAPPQDVRDSAADLYRDLVRSYNLDPSMPLEEVAEAVQQAISDRHAITNRDAIRRLSRTYALSREWISALAGGRSLERFLARSRSVVSGTCVGIGRRTLRVDEAPFDLVVIDEAAKCTAGELAIGMQVGRRILLVGDHKQLPPFAKREHVQALRARFGDSAPAVAETDFERAFSSEYGKVMGLSLTSQYRMAPSIGALVSSCFYPDSPLETKRPEPPPYYEHLNAPLDHEITWLDTSDMGAMALETPDGPSRSNQAEAFTIIRLLRVISESDAFWTCYDEDRDAPEVPIGVIAMYGAQKTLLSQQLVTSGLSARFQKRVTIDTVDSYQGKENPIVIVSLVRNNARGDMGHVQDLRRINVALSRAMERLVLVGASAFVARQPADNPLAQVLAYMKALPALNARLKAASQSFTSGGAQRATA